MYDMGLQGPDFFFYYNPFAKTAIGDLGNVFHSQTGREFFTRACAQADTEAATAYLYGLLGHYCLDSVCHPFVDRMVNIGEAKHIALEAELERFLLHKDGVRPAHTYDRSRHIGLTRGECMTVSAFYPGMDGAYVSRSLWCMAPRCSRGYLRSGNRSVWNAADGYAASLAATYEIRADWIEADSMFGVCVHALWLRQKR
jgi:hypothetical protein